MKLSRTKRPERVADAAVEVSAIALAMPECHGHPNRHAFEGCLTLIDQVSDRAPSGARGHRVILTRDAAVKALPSLLGMAIDFCAKWDGHDARQKCGIITSAEIDGARLMVKGFVFGKDYPELSREAKGGEMGMSYELADAHVSDMRAAVWTLTRATFTGAAVLLRTKAAYRGTSFCMRAVEPVQLSLTEERISVGGGLLRSGGWD